MNLLMSVHRRRKIAWLRAFASGGVQALTAAIGILTCGGLLGFSAPVSARENAVTTLLRQQTELFADVSQRGDQAAMGKLLDDEVLFSGGSGAVDTQNPDPKRDRNDRVSVLLKKRTLAFLAARAHGDRAAIRRLADAQAILVNEDGLVSNPDGFASGISLTLPKGMLPAIAVTGWMFHDLGDVAVTSFTETQSIHPDGQALKYQSLFVEIWAARHDAWMLVGSQNIALHQDPPALPLPAKVLEEYAGEYEAAPGLTATIARDGAALVLSASGRKPTTLLAVARDVFVRPGLPAGSSRPEILFRRDAQGRVMGYVSRAPGLGNLAFARSDPARQPGGLETPAAIAPGDLKLRDFVVHPFGDVAVTTFLHDRTTKVGSQEAHTTYRSSETWIKRGAAWKMISSQGCGLPPDPPAISLAKGVLDDYAGTYRAGPRLRISVRRRGAALTASLNRAKPVTLDAEARDVFFIPGMPLASIVFRRDSDGKVAGCVDRYVERDLAFAKV